MTARPVFAVSLLLVFGVSCACDEVDIAICGFLVPARVQANSTATIEVIYEAACEEHRQTSHEVDGSKITVRAKGEYCPCDDCICSLSNRVVSYEIAGLAPGTYQLDAALVAEQYCDPGRGGSLPAELVVD